MKTKNIIEQLNETKSYIEGRCRIKPTVGVILGSGLGPFADLLENATAIPYSEIPHFLAPSVQGHSGKLVIGTLKGDQGSVNLAVLQGRLHFYEGHDLAEVVYPTRALATLGIKNLILTNAAGGLNPSFREGDIMMIQDHINFSGQNPLRGPNIEKLGPRFPDMTEAYDKSVQTKFRESAQALDIELREGVYMWLTGPTYETPSEIRAARSLGADAVGMSTVPETIVARHMGVSVGAISCITNLGAGMTAQKLKHEDVVVNAQKAVSKIFALLKHSLPKL